MSDKYDTERKSFSEKFRLLQDLMLIEGAEYVVISSPGTFWCFVHRLEKDVVQTFQQVHVWELELTVLKQQLGTETDVANSILVLTSHTAWKFYVDKVEQKSESHLVEFTKCACMIGRKTSNSSWVTVSNF